MGGKKQKAPDVRMPTAGELKPIIDLQAEANRVGVETPFGSQNYRKNADGTTTMVTDIGPLGQQLVGRAASLGMTDSNRLSMPGQLNPIAGALMSRVGQRLGMPMGSFPTQLSQQPAMPQAKPQQQSIPQAQNLPQAPAQSVVQGVPRQQETIR